MYTIEVETPRGFYESPWDMDLKEVLQFLREWHFNPKTDKATIRFAKQYDNTEDLLWYFGHI